MSEQLAIESRLGTSNEYGSPNRRWGYFTIVAQVWPFGKQYILVNIQNLKMVAQSQPFEISMQKCYSAGGLETQHSITAIDFALKNILSVYLYAFRCIILCNPHTCPSR